MASEVSFQIDFSVLITIIFVLFSALDEEILFEHKIKRTYHILCTLQNYFRPESSPYLLEKSVLLSEIGVREIGQGASLLCIPVHRTSVFNKVVHYFGMSSMIQPP